MEHDDRNPLEEVEREALRSWGKDWVPSDQLRERTRRELHARGLLGATPGRRSAAVAWAGMAAAAALAFVLGVGWGRRPVVTPPAPQSGPLYMLLLYENADYRAPTTPEANRERVGEYGSWARAIAESGRFVDGNELAADGRWCRPNGGGLDVAAPVADPVRGTLAGYFVIGASNDEDAIAVTRDCPHLKHGGTVEVRRIASSS
jgi:hypothetical protein